MTEHPQPPKETPLERRQRVADMRAAGMKGKAIAKMLGICPQRVSQLLKAHEAETAKLRSAA